MENKKIVFAFAISLILILSIGSVYAFSLGDFLKNIFGGGKVTGNVIADSSKIINIDFGVVPGQSSNKNGYAVVGNTGDFWNDGNTAGLKFADGSSSSASVSKTGFTGQWGSTYGVNDPMFQSYNYGYGEANVYVNDIPSGNYDLYIYGREGDWQISYQVLSGSNDFGTKTLAKNSAAVTTSYWQEGLQYVVYKNINPSSNITIRMFGGGFSASVINGLQLVPAGTDITSSPIVNGICGVNTNTCLNGTLNDITDNSTSYLWQCKGVNGGSDASCSKIIPSSTLDFYLTTPVSVKVVTQGASVVSNIVVVASSGSGNVNLSVSGNPFGTTYSFTPNASCYVSSSGTPSCARFLNISTSMSTPVGSYWTVVTGNDEITSETIALTLIVNSATTSFVNGVCGVNTNTCLNGTLNDITDNSTSYLWQCLGSNGGVNVSCSSLSSVNNTNPVTTCSDSDGGINFNLQGDTTFNIIDYNYTSVHTDYCASSNILAEGSCIVNLTGNGMVSNLTSYVCPNGCLNGACIQNTTVNQTTTCSDSDGGLNYFVKGNTSGIWGLSSSFEKHTDLCDGGNTLYEYFCTNLTNMYVDVTYCQNGCSNGTCNNATVSNTCSNGCSFDSRCVQYGYRNGSQYCDIDGIMKLQKVKLGNLSASCDNSYECSSNFCSAGKCLEVNELLDENGKFRAFVIRALCRLGTLLGDNYEQCLIDNLGESSVNGVCGVNTNTCTNGTLFDITDNSTSYLWQCLGTNTGSNASCSYPKNQTVSSSNLNNSATRILPNSYNRSVPLNVLINITFKNYEGGIPSEKGCAGAYVEYLPSGWSVSNIIGPGYYNSSLRRIAYAPLTGSLCSGNDSIIIGYTLVADTSVYGTQYFNGSFSVDGYSYSVGGSNSISPIQPVICSDSDGGVNYNVTGEVTGWNPIAPGNFISMGDHCFNAFDLNEIYCDGNYVTQAGYRCPQSCSGGKCIDLGGDDGIYTVNITYPVGGLLYSVNNLTYIPDGVIYCGNNTNKCSSVYNYSQQVVIISNPLTGYASNGWQGDCSETFGNICTLTMISDKYLGANFIHL